MLAQVGDGNAETSMILDNSGLSWVNKVLSFRRMVMAVFDSPS